MVSATDFFTDSIDLASMARGPGARALRLIARLTGRTPGVWTVSCGMPYAIAGSFVRFAPEADAAAGLAFYDDT